MLIEIAKIHFKHVRNGPRRPILIVSHDTSSPLQSFEISKPVGWILWLYVGHSYGYPPGNDHILYSIPPMEVEPHFPTFKGDM